MSSGGAPRILHPGWGRRNPPRGWELGPHARLRTWAAPSGLREGVSPADPHGRSRTRAIPPHERPSLMRREKRRSFESFSSAFVRAYWQTVKGGKFSMPPDEPVEETVEELVSSVSRETERVQSG